MGKPTARFFEDLAGRGHEPLLERTRTTVRFEVRDGDRLERHLLRIHDGDLSLTDDDDEAHCTLRADVDTFDRLAEGRRNPMAATLAGEFEIEGDAKLLIRIQRLFPDAQGTPETASNRQAGKRRS
jgi:putative sterol carrier protein